MHSLLIFDGLNDIVFMNNDEDFIEHIQHVLVLQGLQGQEGENINDLNVDIVMQLFSPLVTSQRIMLHHFSNPYSEVQCYGGLNITFSEYVGYVFVSMGYASLYWLKRYLGVFISVVRRTCGPDVSKLKTDENLKILVRKLLNMWWDGRATEQSVLVEAIEQFRVPPNAASACLQNLTEFAEKMKSELSVSQVHAFVTVHHRFLSLYSSRNASELFFSDVLLLSLIGETVKDHKKDADYPNYSNKSCSKISGIQKEFIDISENKFIILLGKQKPHVVHIHRITPYANVFLIYEIGNEHTHNILSESLHSLCVLQDISARGAAHKGIIQSHVEATDSFFKILNEVLKKKTSLGNSKTHFSDIKVASKKWEILKKQYQDYWKSCDAEQLHKIDSAIENIMFILRNVYTNCLMDVSMSYLSRKVTSPIWQSVHKTLQNLIKISSILDTSNWTLGTKSALSINKYLEEFPGLIHFIYIDRTTHRFLAPDLEFSSQETVQLTRKKVLHMVQFAWLHLEEGRTAVMWKDTVFSYSYFLWFEDVSGTPMKPKVCPTMVAKTSLIPGTLNGDYYNYLVKKCFPSLSANKIRCHELFLVHLGLITSSCVLEQSRRLTATIWEVTGIPTNPLDLI